DKIISGDGDFIATVKVTPVGQYAVLALVEALDLHAIQDPDLRPLPGAGEQDRFEIDLVDTMRRLGSRPPRVRPLRRIVSVSPGRNRDPRQLTADDRRAIGAIIRKIGRKTA